jgi:CubicO group peptidase (beta-lactamase class C family)
MWIGFWGSRQFRNRFFDPLGLENTFMSIEEPLDGELANGHINGIDFSWFPREALDSAGWTAFSIFSTAEDLAWWAQALFGGSVLGEEYLGKMLDFKDMNEVYWEGPLKQGLGIWSVETPQFGEIWNHEGTWPCYSSLMGYLPDRDIVFVVLMNEYFTDRFAVMKILLEAILK